jgi:hypothetical protein
MEFRTALLASLYSVFVFVHGLAGLEFIFDQAVIDLFTGYARGFESARIFEKRRRSRHYLTRAAGRKHHVSKLALRSFGLHGHLDLSPSRPLGGRSNQPVV